MPRVIARLLISCPDGPGIVAAVSSFLAGRGANILSSDQYTTDPTGELAPSSGYHYEGITGYVLLGP